MVPERLFWKDAGPGIIRQIGEFVVLGRNYINVVARADDQVQQMEPKKFLFFFTFSRIVGQQESYLVYAPSDTLRGLFEVVPGRALRKGDVIARGAVDTGDQVFVDKFSYNFVKPHRGDVFVFRTDSIEGVDPRAGRPGSCDPPGPGRGERSVLHQTPGRAARR